MPLNFITGAPGSGKTTVTNEMISRGLTAYDTDDQDRTGMSGWHNLKTGGYVAGFNELDVTEEFLLTHSWKLTDRSLSELKERSQHELIYLCGRLRDAEAVIIASKQIFFLTVSGESIESRLKKRATIPGKVEWGKEYWQIERSVAVNKEIEEEYRVLGAIMINANRPLKNVVDDIILATA
jgi:broad-specificity NMP kinase